MVGCGKNVTLWLRSEVFIYAYLDALIKSKS